MRRALGAPGLILLVAALLAVQGCSGSSAATHTASTSPELTLSAAHQAYDTFIAADDVARASGDEWLEVSLVAYGRVGLTTAAYQTADYLGHRVPRYKYGTPQLFVPRVNRYPYWFVAAVPRTPVGGGPTRTAIMVFDKQVSSDPWYLISLSLLGQGETLPSVAVDSSGYATPLATFDKKVPVSPNTVGALQATEAQDGPHSSATKVVGPGPYTTGVHAQIVAAQKQAAAQGYHYDALLSGASDPVAALATSDGGALVAYTLNLNSVTLRSNDPVRQIEIPPAYAPLLNGSLVVQYELDTTEIDQYAAVISPKATPGKPPVTVISFDGGPTNANGH